MGPRLSSVAWEDKESRLKTLGALVSAIVLLLSVISVVAIGILSAYAVVIGILNAFGNQQAPAATPARILVPSQTHASGD